MAETVVIFKAPTELDSDEQNDPYVKYLTSIGFKCLFVPVLDFEYHNLSQLAESLENPTYSGIILTSPRAFHAVSRATQKPLNLTAWVVGPSTNEYAKKLNLITIGQEAGNGSELADLIIANKANNLIYPKGNLASDIIFEKLESIGINVKCIEVYRTVPHSELEKNIAKLPQNAIYVFFSPSGVQFVEENLKKFNGDLSQIKAFTIGKTTEKSALESGFNVCGVAKNPNPESLAEVMKNCLLPKM